MHDQLKDKKLDELNENLAGINKKMGNFWFSFGRGVLSGFGYVLGAGVAIILIGWFLTVVGVFEPLKNTAEQWREAFQATQGTTNSIISPGTTVETAPAE